MGIMISTTVYSAKYRVNTNPSINANFSSLQDAINSSSVNAGDTLYCENGSFFGDITLDKRLVIIGPGYFLSQNDSTHAYPSPAIINTLQFADGCDGSTITGMKIIGSCVIGTTTNDTIKNISIIRSSIKNIISYTNSNSLENIVIRQNFIYEDIYNFITSTKSIFIQNNIILGKISITPLSGEISNNTIISEKANTYVLEVRNTQIFNNIIINTSVSTYVATRAISSGPLLLSYNNSISNNVVSDAAYADWGSNYFNATLAATVTYTGSPDAKYTLKAGSPAIAYGHNGNDCGAFGGSYPYVLSGLPYLIPHIYEATVPGSANKTDGLNITIKAKAQNQ